jgi:hypothetical protein
MEVKKKPVEAWTWSEMQGGSGGRCNQDWDFLEAMVKRMREKERNKVCFPLFIK